MVLTLAATAAAVTICSKSGSAAPATCAVEVSLDEPVSTNLITVRLETVSAEGSFEQVGSDPPCRHLFAPEDAPFLDARVSKEIAIVSLVWPEAFEAQGPVVECDFHADTEAGLPTTGDFTVALTIPPDAFSVSAVECLLDPTTTTTTTTSSTTSTSITTGPTTTTTTEPPPTGACCFGGRRCSITTPDACFATYLGDGSTCEECGANTTLPANTTTTLSTTTTTTTTTLPSGERCSQPVSTGEKPIASDCLFILKVAVGLEACTPVCVCNVNGDASTTASDALGCLNAVVGNPVSLACPCGGRPPRR